MEDETPWDYLGLDEKTATKKDAKRAYARLLKVTRPDQKPEEFQKLREAYDLVNQWIDQREWSKRFMEETIDLAHTTEPETESDGTVIKFPDSTTEEASDPETAPGENTPVGKAIHFTPLDVPELDEIFQRLREASNRNLEDKFNAAFAEGTAFTHDFPDCLEEWGHRVTELCENHPERIVRNFKRKDVVFELENDSRIQSGFLLQDMLRRGAYYDLGVLANHLREDAKRLTNPTAASYFTDLADAIGFVQPNRGTQLLDLAFPYLPPGYRDYEVNRIEFRINRGKMFSGAFAEKRREFWDARIREMEEGREYDWWSEAAREEIGALNGAMLTQPILNELEHLLPEEIFERVVERGDTFSNRDAPPNILKRRMFHPKYYLLFGLVLLKLIIVLLAIGPKPKPNFTETGIEPPFSLVPDSYKREQFDQFLQVSSADADSSSGSSLDPEVAEAFFGKSPSLGTSGLVKLRPFFFPDALREPKGEIERGSLEHLNRLSKAITSDKIPLSHRNTIPKIISEEFQAELAVQTLTRLYFADPDSDTNPSVYTELRNLRQLLEKKPDKNSLKPALPAPQ